MKKLTALPALLLFVFAAVNAYAQDETIDIYGIGDQTFSINAGTILPLFIFGVDGTSVGGFSKLTVGAAGSLRWTTFLNNEMTIGVDVGGMFALTKLDRVLIMLPVSGMFTYAIRFYPFEVLLQAGLGVSFTKLDDDLYIGPVLKPGASFYWNYSGEWSFGVQADYWFVPEIYFGSKVPAEQSAFGNFLGITLTTLYHFQ
ncbi:MAG: hypothetical protein JW852_01515 [Spirochaetales bacterium]|nr:hypothetical protein [Spirochaetales bacterium]